MGGGGARGEEERKGRERNKMKVKATLVGLEPSTSSSKLPFLGVIFLCLRCSQEAVWLGGT